MDCQETLEARSQPRLGSFQELLNSTDNFAGLHEAKQLEVLQAHTMQAQPHAAVLQERLASLGRGVHAGLKKICM